ncbi:MAG: hypothetical protein EOO38_19855, partial [Cytophagaceae bacterium]
MTTDADDLHKDTDDDNGTREENADDIAMRTVNDFYSTWKSEGAEASEVLDSNAQRDPCSYLYSREVVGESTDITSILRRALPAALTPPAPLSEDELRLPSANTRPRFSEELTARRMEVRVLAEKLLGSRGAAQRWFATPLKYKLKGRPIDFME